MVRDDSQAVIAGIHDRESGRAVLAQAIDLAARLQAPLVVAHVQELPAAAAGLGLPASGMAGPPAVPVLRDAAETAEERAAQERWVVDLRAEVAAELGLAWVPWSLRRGMGDPGRVLAEIADELDAYCVVVGSRGEGMMAMFGRMFRPSVSRSVLRERSVPVLVVPSTEEDEASARSA